MTKEEILEKHFPCSTYRTVEKRPRILHEDKCPKCEREDDILAAMDEYAKEKAIAFIKWLIVDNKFVPNSSFLWFCHTESREDVRFFKLEELYDIFEQGGDWKVFMAKKEASLIEDINKIINKSHE